MLCSKKLYKKLMKTNYKLFWLKPLFIIVLCDLMFLYVCYYFLNSIIFKRNAVKFVVIYWRISVGKNKLAISRPHAYSDLEEWNEHRSWFPKPLLGFRSKLYIIHTIRYAQPLLVFVPSLVCSRGRRTLDSR